MTRPIAPLRDPLLISKAEADDLAEVSELLLRAVPDCIPQTVDQLWERLDQIWVAREVPGGPILASATLVELDAQRQELRSVIVEPGARGSGVGQELIARLLASEESGDGDVCCVTRHPGFFQRLGFVPIGVPWESGATSTRTRKRIPMRRRNREVSK
ncbi:MAG: GNAT family N-acetyltransferase [Candidatus Eisenbacteria bacterium]